MSILTGNSGYKAWEKAYPDKFWNPYVGKIYDDATEVLSMGLEILGSEDSFIQSISDIEHLEFCFGCFNSNPVNRNNVTYSVDSETLNYSNEEKIQDWHEAIDNAMSPSFVQQLYGKEVERYKIVENDNGNLVLKHNRTDIYTCYSREEGERTRLARIAYLAICNFKGLIPEADPKLEKKGLFGGICG